MASKRLLAIQDLADRLSYIKKSNNYSSDAGDMILLGEAPVLGKDDPAAALAIFLLNDEPLGDAYTKGALNQVRVPIEVHAVAKLANGQQALIVYEGLIEDIKKAVEIEGRDSGTNAARDRYLGVIPDSSPAQPVTLPKGFERGATRIHFREGGSEIIGVTVEYFMSIEEPWGQP